ncbi:GNAT family N-acetyltransferase [Burkholderia pyrrocinia]|uniref:GNAT family N-acetyltransferase n=1 Tax=Burkholderia pyrrocinia TaxID=60550 RepID=UPI0015772163|nr:GNAT family N-acetyltransferase [Burkholderia pyrrocinia]NTX28054.1 GNAT family N-acetyltransferase [Burkholderia pyrrocinia]QVN19129.1 GNAT family N-acetyltransferase [Burkholderia pyrrocinia]
MPDATTGNATGNAHPLDHVVWNALTGKQRRFALGNDRALRFPAAIAPFAAIADTGPASFDALRELIAAHGPAALVTPDEIETPARLSVIRRATLLQMIWQGAPDPTYASEHVTLAETDVPDMLALTTAAQPGPFGPRTIELGDYIGVRSEGRLAAMAGERMQIDGYTEISAVCVDAAFRRQGLAARLIRSLIAATGARAETPFLHVLTSNQVAIERYLALGFVVRREMNLLVLGDEHA